jgi:hypothetical protein
MCALVTLNSYKLEGETQNISVGSFIIMAIQESSSELY